MVACELYWLLEITGGSRVSVGRVCDSEIVNTVIWHRRLGVYGMKHGMLGS
jgi:hypothetical protein